MDSVSSPHRLLASRNRGCVTLSEGDRPRRDADTDFLTVLDAQSELCANRDQLAQSQTLVTVQFNSPLQGNWRGVVNLSKRSMKPKNSVQTTRRRQL